MIIGQLGEVAGVHVPRADPPLEEVTGFARHAADAHGPTLALACGVLVLLVAGARRLPRAPVPLVVMLLAAAVEAAEPPARWLLVNAEADVAVARVKREVADDLRRAGLLDRIGADRVLATLPTAVEAYRCWRAEHPAPS